MRNSIRVTISGADDQTDIGALAVLSKAYPFVEWGILYSIKRNNGAAGEEKRIRYPSREWIACAFQHSEPTLRFAIHLCGYISEAVMSDNVDLPTLYKGLVPYDRRAAESTSAYRNETLLRFQLNGWTPESTDSAATRCWNLQRLASQRGQQRIILQCRREEDLAAAVAAASRYRGDVLYDASGGRGVASSGWPDGAAVKKLTYEAPSSPVDVGYAGGIGPDNINSVLEALTAEDRGDFWIDMESNVRRRDHYTSGDNSGRVTKEWTEDKLDLKKVEAVLEAVDRVRRAK